MKHILPLLFVGLSCLTSHAQEFFRLNERLNTERISPEILIIGEQTNQIYALRGVMEKPGGEATYYLDIFDNYMQRAKRVKLQEEHEKSTVYPVNGFIMDGKVYLLIFFQDKDSKKYEFYVWEVNEESGEYVPSRKKLASIEADEDLLFNALLPRGKDRGRLGNTEITFSPDRSYFTVSLWFEQNKYLYLGLYDNKAELLKSKRERRSEHGYAAFELENPVVTNAGNFYISKPNKPRNRRGVEGVAVTNAIVGYSNFGNEKLELDIIPVVKTDVRFTPMHITMDEKGHLQVYAFYMNNATYAIEGIFNAELNPLTLAIENESYIEIKTKDWVSGREAEWLQQLIRGRDEAMKYKNSFIQIRQIDFTPEGEAQIFAEITFDKASVNSEEVEGLEVEAEDVEDGARPKDYTYSVADKLIIRVSPKNELKWARRIPHYFEVENGGRQRTHSAYFFNDGKAELFFTGDLEMFKTRRTNFKVTDLKQAVMLRAIFEDDGRWRMNYYTFNQNAPAEVMTSGDVLPTIKLDGEGGYALPVYNASKGGTMMIQVPEKMVGYVF